MKKLFMLFITLFFLFFGCDMRKQNASLVDSLFFVIQNESREFFFTNKRYAQYYGETNSLFKNSWQGWTFKEKRIFFDYEIYIDGKPLNRNSSLSRLYPHKLERYYDRFKETFVFADSVDYLGIRIEGDRFKFFDLLIYGEFENIRSKLDGKKIVFELGEYLENFKLVIISNLTPLSIKAEDKFARIRFSRGSYAKINFSIVEDSDNVFFAENFIDNAIIKKKSRIEKLLEKSFVQTNDAEFNKALAWAKISLDALIATQDFKGIYAGLPWFNNFWGRDVFISLPGATYVINNFVDAREILLSFAKAQDSVRTSKYYGRIPNRITLNEKIYNTADATPRFAIQAYEYFLYSGDLNFIKEIYPCLKRSIEGSLIKWIDENGFLICEDAETWMDAVGPKGPWSPRGNKANDIQALWHQQLISVGKIARILGDSSYAKFCFEKAEKVKRSFLNLFVNKKENIIYDRISADEKIDLSFRPNLFFVLNAENFIEDADLKTKILSKAFEKLVLPYGVLSLSQDDNKFLAYHNFPPYYPKDAAYHNGIIWQWLSGPVIQSLTSFYAQDKAWVLTESLTKEILYRGAPGALAEVMDALPRKGEKEPRLSGTFVQAWSLAEYVRNFYQNYLGISVNAKEKTIYFIPTLPQKINFVKLIQNVGEKNKIEIEYQKNENITKIKFKVLDAEDEIIIASALRTENDKEVQFKKALKPGDELIVVVPSILIDEKDCLSYLNAAKVNLKFYFASSSYEHKKFIESLKFANPIDIDDFLAKLKVDFKLLKNDEVVKWNNRANEILRISDIINDERFEYPLNHNFKRGILDLKEFSVLQDDDSYYFEMTFSNLADPGWHREYGFQLTFAAIAIRSDNSSAFSADIGYNSNYLLPKGREFSRLIIVGGGIEILNEKNKIIAAYYPEEQDFKNPMGDVKNKRIRFSLRKDLIGKITESTKITVLIGAQDDGGGAGIGVFRDVEEKASEWKGGGKKNLRDNNIYDILIIN